MYHHYTEDSWDTVISLYHHDGHRCPGTKQTQGHLHPSCWPQGDYSATLIILHNSYGSGHKGGAVLLPGNKTVPPSWPETLIVLQQLKHIQGHQRGSQPISFFIIHKGYHSMVLLPYKESWIIEITWNIYRKRIICKFYLKYQYKLISHISLFITIKSKK